MSGHHHPKRTVTFSSAFRDFKDRINIRSPSRDNLNPPQITTTNVPSFNQTGSNITITLPHHLSTESGTLTPPDTKHTRSLSNAQAPSLLSKDYAQSHHNDDKVLSSTPPVPTKSDAPNALRRSHSVPTQMQQGGNIKTSQSTNTSPKENSIIQNEMTAYSPYDEMTIHQINNIAHLDYELFNNILLLRSGPFRSLVECLVLVNGLLELETFFLSYRLFAKPIELFETIVKIYDNYCEEDAMGKRRIGRKRNLPLPLLKQKIFAFLRHWMDSGMRTSACSKITSTKDKKTQTDHTHNPQTPIRNIRLLALEFAETRLGNEQANILKLLYIKSQKARLSDLFKAYSETKSEVEAELSPSLGRAVKLLDINPRELADQMTLVELEFFREVLPFDILRTAFGSTVHHGTSHNQAESLVRITQHFNKMTSWVASEIVTADNTEKQVTLFKKFVLAANRLLELRNFHSLFEIVLGLNHFAVLRLKPLQKAVSQKYKDALKKYESLVSPNGNYKAYRSLLRSCTYCIPILAVLQRDMMYMHEGNPTFVNGMRTEEKSNTEGQIINFEKLRTMADMVFAYIAAFASPFTSPSFPYPVSSSTTPTNTSTTSTPTTSNPVSIAASLAAAATSSSSNLLPNINNSLANSSLNLSSLLSAMPLTSSNKPVLLPIVNGLPGSNLSMSGFCANMNSSSSSSTSLFAGLTKQPHLFSYILDVQPLAEDKIHSMSLRSYDPNSMKTNSLGSHTNTANNLTTSLSSSSLTHSTEHEARTPISGISPATSPVLSPNGSPIQQNLSVVPSSLLNVVSLSPSPSTSPSPPILRKEAVLFSNSLDLPPPKT
eukprot:TRINITY_DN7337_c0_g1_i2.p1 TRINITY_DN7337_c0_g1~~TRINITY_DN7337_c0_g1_i2.p1  ORF type:complete len:831 (+),score=161.85 TRINITY_DN7337_c0_g1_i2:48-2540(+)